MVDEEVGNVVLLSGGDQYQNNDSYSFNSSNANGTEDEGGGREETTSSIEQGVLLSIFTVTVTGCSLVLWGIYQRPGKSIGRMYYFYLHLTIADLITAFFQVLSQFFWKITGNFVGGWLICKIVKFTQILGPYSSSFILLVSALDRYKAISDPLNNRNWSPNEAKRALGTVWALACICCLPQLHFFTYVEVEGGGFDCWAIFEPEWMEQVYVLWYALSFFLIPYVITSWANVRIMSIVCSNYYYWKRLGRSAATTSVEDAKNDDDKYHGGNNGGISIEVQNGGVVRIDDECEEEEEDSDDENEKPPQKRSRSLSKKLRRKLRLEAFSTENKENGGDTRTIRGGGGIKVSQNSLRVMQKSKQKTGILTCVMMIINIACSTPYLGAMVWMTCVPGAKVHPFFRGTTMAVLSLLASLNFCANGWLILAFNPQLFPHFIRQMWQKDDGNNGNGDGSSFETRGRVKGRQEGNSTQEDDGSTMSRTVALAIVTHYPLT